MLDLLGISLLTVIHLLIDCTRRASCGEHIPQPRVGKANLYMLSVIYSSDGNPDRKS